MPASLPEYTTNLPTAVTGSDNSFEGLGLARATIFGHDGSRSPIIGTPVRPPRERHSGSVVVRRMRAKCPQSRQWRRNWRRGRRGVRR